MRDVSIATSPFHLISVVAASNCVGTSLNRSCMLSMTSRRTAPSSVPSLTRITSVMMASTVSWTSLRFRRLLMTMATYAGTMRLLSRRS